MSATLLINNFSSRNTKEIGEFGADATIGDTSLTLANNNNIVANDQLLLGTVGSERDEIVEVSSKAGNTVVTTSALAFAHLSGQPIRVLNGNQIKVYRAADTNNLQPADSSFAVFTGSTVNIDPDQMQTLFTDTNGSSGFWYKATFFNSLTNTETSLADSAAARGGQLNYCTLDQIRDDSGIKSRFITDAMVDIQRQAAQVEVNSAAAGRYTLPFTMPISPAITKITIVLAAGYLMMAQYDQFTNIYSQGEAKVKWASAKLDALKSGQLDIIGANGQSISVPNSSGFSGYPNATTADETDGAEDFMFTRDSIAGYNGREY
jgi:hypothetical protein